MALPLFFHNAPINTGSELSLDEDTARHIVQVLRMQAGENIRLTNGKGIEAVVEIVRTEKKKCFVRITEIKQHEPVAQQLTLCMSFTKNASRNEWLLEKATELGVQMIVPLMTTRTEREHFRFDRLNNILISAMMQSQQYYLPELKEPTVFSKVTNTDAEQKLIAHCMDTVVRAPLHEVLQRGKNTVICIGPEGDFTTDEVNEAIAAGFKGISLGVNRLRTETAAMAVCAYFNMINS